MIALGALHQGLPLRESNDLGINDDWSEVSDGSYNTNNVTTISYDLSGGSSIHFIRLQVLSNP